MQLKLELRNGRLRPVVLERESNPKRNSYVETLQACLAAAGFFKGTADGKFGADTENAVKAFQKAAGLKETGRVDPETAEKLDQKVAQLIDTFNQAKEIEDYLGTEEEEQTQDKDEGKGEDKKKDKDKKDEKKQEKDEKKEKK